MQSLHLIPSYQTQSLDTSIEAEQHLFRLWRSWSIAQRSARLNATTQSARRLALETAQRILPKASAAQQTSYFLRKVLDSAFIPLCQPKEDIQVEGAIDEALTVAAILDALCIPYLVGDSVASGIYGEMRYTQDIDLVARLKLGQVAEIIQAFSPRFYTSKAAIREAIDRGGSFNLIDNETGWKIDILVLTDAAFKQSEFQRRQPVPVNSQGETLVLPTAEDLILQKLLWYRMTHNQSDKQWRDILGVMKLQGETLDFDYLWQWAEPLNVAESLASALAAAGLF